MMMTAPVGTLRKYDIISPARQDRTANKLESKNVFFRSYVSWQAADGGLMMRLKMRRPPTVCRLNVTDSPVMISKA